MIARIILFVVALACFVAFVEYDEFDLMQDRKVLVVTAKASTAYKGQLTGAFLAYSQVKDSVPFGALKIMSVDKAQYNTTNVGDYKIETTRSQLAYMILVAGVVAVFIFFMTLDIDVSDLFDCL